MSIGFNLTTRSKNITVFQKLLNVVASRHNAAINHGEDSSELTICRLGTLFFSYETEDNEVAVTGECQSNLLGAGFHKAAIELIDEIADLNGFPFTVEDDTEYYDHRDFNRMRTEHFYPWLSKIMELCHERMGEDYKMLAVCWDIDKYMPQEVPGAVVTPFGLINLEHFIARQSSEGIEALAADFYMWNNEERDALFYRNSALSALWEDCYFMPSARSDEDEEINGFILENLEIAAKMDASLPFPKEDYLQVCRLAEKEPIDLSALPDYVSDYPIGYRKGKVIYRLGNVSFTLPGNLFYFEEEDSRGYCDDAEEAWHVVRTVAYSIQDDEISYLENNKNVLTKERFFENGKCRLYDLGGGEDGSDEYVYQCQVITERQFSLFTISCGGKEAADAFCSDFTDTLTATKEDKHAKLLQQIEQWNANDEEQKIVDAILEIPEEERTVELKGLLARAYNNMEEYIFAEEALLSIEEESREDTLWYFRLGYAYYYLNRLEEAQKAFERSLELNPGDEDTEEFIRLCKTGESPYHPEMYAEEEIDALDAHIDKYFGKSENVFHEIASPDIHVDIYIIEPTRKRNYYTLITMGMGARRMKAPDELKEYKLERAEIIVYLPANWNVTGSDDKDYWPVRWLKLLARLPIQNDTWLGWGHTVPNGGPFAPNTQLSGVMLVNPESVKEGASVCKLPGGDEVNFYQMIPLYEEEMNFKIENGAEALLEIMDDVNAVVDIHRRNVCG